MISRVKGTSNHWLSKARASEKATRKAGEGAIMIELSQLSLTQRVAFAASRSRNAVIRGALKSQVGYSLVELVVAGLILGLVVIAMVAMTRSQGVVQDEAELRQRAHFWLTRMIEQPTLFPDRPRSLYDTCLALRAKWHDSVISLQPENAVTPVPATLSMACTPLTEYNGMTIDKITQIDLGITWVGDNISNTLYVVDSVANR